MSLRKQIRNKHKEWGPGSYLTLLGQAIDGIWEVDLTEAGADSVAQRKVSEGSPCRPSLTLIGVYNMTFQ